MSNPVSPLPSAQLPLTGTPIVDPMTGMASTLMHRFMVGLWQRTGGANGVSSGDVEQVAQNAANTAAAAAASAALAEQTAQSAQTAATTAQTTANVALSAASTANSLASSLQTSKLAVANNLSDVASATTARSNLGVSTTQVSVQFDTFAGNDKRYVPICRKYTLGANFAGLQVFAAVAPTADAPFTVSLLRSGGTISIGTITLTGTGHFVSVQPAVSINVGDVLCITAPNPADATLAGVALSFLLTLA